MSISKIRTKLILLVLGVMVLKGLALAAWAAIRSPVERLKAERETLLTASQALSDLRLESNRLLLSPPLSEEPRLEAAASRIVASMESIKALKAIPALGADQADAVRIVANVCGMAGESFAALGRSYRNFVASIGSEDLAPLNFGTLAGSDRGAAADLVLPLMALTQKASELSEVVDIGNQSIEAQYALVDEGIARLESRALLLGLAAAILIIAGTLALAIRIASGISATIEGLARKVSALSTGDLSVRFVARSRDELGHLAGSLNTFLEVLSGFHSRIREAADANRDLLTRLRSMIESAMSSAEEIGAGTESIAKRMGEMDSLGRGSKDSVVAAREAFAGLLSQVEGEARLVADSSAAVTKMLASIGNIARIAEADRSLASGLVAVTEEGRAVFEESFDRVSGISDSVDVIQEMAAVIRGVAEQTNLLAMNAAIEAAHAGESGKGFAVVADEIRKLSETAGESSRGISRTIAEVTERIQGAVGTRKATAEAFEAISARIAEVSRSVTEIHSNVAEMESGGKQVLDAITELRERSEEVAGRSRAFDLAAEGLTVGMESLIRLSGEVVSDIGEISSGIGYIGESVHGVSDVAEGAAATGSRLEKEITLFRA